MSDALRQVQREINPLERKGRNPVKEVVTATAKARKTRARSDIGKAATKHDVAIAYSQRRGLPRLVQQLKKHKKALPAPISQRKTKQSKRAPRSMRSH